MIKDFKIFEKRRNVEYKGVRQKQKEAIDRSNRLRQFVSGLYIVIDYGERGIIFGKIIRTKHEESSYTSYRYGLSYDDQTPVTYLIIDVIDFVEKEEVRFPWIEIGKQKELNIDLLNVLHISNTFKGAEEKYKEVAEECIIKRDANKYNL